MSESQSPEAHLKLDTLFAPARMVEWRDEYMGWNLVRVHDRFPLLGVFYAWETGHDRYFSAADLPTLLGWIDEELEVD